MQQKFRFFKATIYLFALFCFNSSYAASDLVQFKIFIADSNYTPTVTSSGAYLTVTFSDGTLNSLISGYHITRFERLHGVTRHAYLKQFWIIEVDNIALMTDLLGYNSSVFKDGAILPYMTPISTYPNDYGKYYSGDQGELDLIFARDAWTIDTGNASIIIGEIDSYFDTANIDIKNKIYKIRSDNYILSNGSVNHGTATAGCMAGQTNNDTLLASICPLCRLEVTDTPQYDVDTMTQMSKEGLRILNASWGACGSTWGTSDFIMQYDEMYENGSFFVCSAGNGIQSTACNSNSDYLYPAAASHNFSVTAVGYDPISTTNNSKYLHDGVTADTTQTFTHNPRVDLMAPGYNVNVLISGSKNGGHWVEESSGTSFSSPIVAGAAGLLLSHMPALSPYQLAYVLKKTANDTPFNFSMYPQNAQYSGRLGAGVLNARDALQYLNSFSNTPNDPALQTLTVDGIELNTICAPGYSTNSVKPQLSVLVSNGTPPFTYTWMPLNDSNSKLSDVHSAAPTIDSAWGNYIVDYYLVVTDATTPHAKMGSRHVTIKLDTAQKWDLAMRDSYVDMLDEPNSQATLDYTQWKIWNSQDIWNRVAQDDSTTHQDPQYTGTSDSNYVYTRIRNVGCIPAPAGKSLRLYWTKASTGETWKGDWDTATYNGWPAGLEITSGGPIRIDSLAPGQDTVYSIGWIPPRPQNYNDTLKDVEACLLARIEDGHNPLTTDSMSYVEVPRISTNVINNNNIVTRNLTVYNLSGFKMPIHQVGIGNSEASQQIFNIDIATDKHFQHHLAGDISAIISTIKLTLSPGLFTAWASGGYEGNYTDYDPSQHTVRFTSVSDFMQLKNILLAGGQKETVMIETDGNTAIGTYQFAPINLNVLQDLVSGGGDSTIYGDVTYTIVPDTSVGHKSAPSKVAQVKAPRDVFYGYPNPTTGTFVIATTNYKSTAVITVTDVLGKVVSTVNHDFSSASSVPLDLSQNIPGIYAIKIQCKTGATQVLKVVRE